MSVREPNSAIDRLLHDVGEAMAQQGIGRETLRDDLNHSYLSREDRIGLSGVHSWFSRTRQRTPGGQYVLALQDWLKDNTSKPNKPTKQ